MNEKIGPFFVQRTLGNGSFSKVKLAIHEQTQELVAIKIIKKALEETNPDIIQKAKREIALMRLFRHPHLLKLIDVLQSPNHFYLIIEYAGNGQLFDLLVNKSCSLDDAINYFRQIISGVEYLHCHAICHRDLKPENLLLSKSNQIKISDFGFARWMDGKLERSCGTIFYAAPEILMGSPYDGRAADVWSCGVIFFSMVSGKLPFVDSHQPILVNKIKTGEFIMPNVDPDIQDLIRGMLNVNPSARFTIQQIKSHPGFRKNLEPNFITPSPIVMPIYSEPIIVDSENVNVLNVLSDIFSFSIEKVVEALASEGKSIVKMFFQMLTVEISLPDLPWSENQNGKIFSPSVSEENFLNPSTPFPLKSFDQFSFDGGSSPFLCSHTQHELWPGVDPSSPRTDLRFTINNICCPLQHLCFFIQDFFSSEFEWLFPDDLTFFLRKVSDSVYLWISIDFEFESLLLNLNFYQTPEPTIHLIMDDFQPALQNFLVLF